MRVFFAISLPKPVTSELTSLAHPTPGIRWIPETNLHLTLQFIGKVDPALLEQLAERARSVSLPPFDVQLSGVGAFPDSHQPRVLWVGLTGGDRLNTLSEKLNEAIQDLDFARERRNFSAHITVARIRHGKRVDVRHWMDEYRMFRGSAFRIDSFHLFSSELRPQGALYRILKTYPLEQYPP